MSIRDGEVIEVVLDSMDRVIGVYALDEEGERAVSIGNAISNVNFDYPPSGPGRVTLDLMSMRTVTTREVT